MRQKNKKRWVARWFKRISALLLLWIIVHMTVISIEGLRDYPGKADVAIILGNHVFADGTLSPWLQGRVDKALVLYKTGRVKKIFASGGVSKEGSGYPEGDGMKAYLMKHGVPSADITADNAGQNTFLTARNFLAWNRQRHYQSAFVVSQFYHITRSRYILQKMGFPHVYGASSETYTIYDLLGTLREVPALYKYMIVY